MKKCLETTLFIFLIAALCSWNGGKAQASHETPKKIQRDWAEPDCGNYDSAVTLSRHFYLKSTDKEMTLLPVSLGKEQQDYWILDLAGEDKPARLENDAILKIGAYAEDSPRKPKSWEGLKLDETLEYTGCLDTPKIVPKVMQRLMRYIDRVKEQCTISVNNECAGVLFKLADDNGDKKLNTAEIRRTVGSFALFAALAANKTLTSQDALKLVDGSRVDGMAIATLLIKEYDKDKSQTLDYNELMTDFHAPDLPIVKETLQKAGELLPSFKVAAMTLK
ncbi:MAG: hypothetical protein ACAH83_15030 [Alphaproteobacteria bacterium]